MFGKIKQNNSIDIYEDYFMYQDSVTNTVTNSGIEVKVRTCLHSQVQANFLG